MTTREAWAEWSGQEIDRRARPVRTGRY